MKLNKEVLIIYDYNVNKLTVFDSTSVASSKFSFSNFFLSKPCVRRRLTFEVTPTMRYNPWSSKPSLRYCKCYIYFSIQNTNGQQGTKHWYSMMILPLFSSAWKHFAMNVNPASSRYVWWAFPGLGGCTYMGSLPSIASSQSSQSSSDNAWNV